MKTHGMSKSAEYVTWKGIVSRCTCESDTSWPKYGARGVTVCDRWRTSFVAFMDDMGPRPSPDHSIDRFPNGGGNYEPGNCRWATGEEQARNRRSNRLLTWNGTTATMAEWAERTGLPYYVIKMRLAKLGWDVERALSEPKRRCKQRAKADAD